MKIRLLALMLLAFFASSAQPIDTTLSNDRRYASIAKSQRHGLMVWFTGQPFEVTADFMIYMQMRANYKYDERLSKPLPNGGMQSGFRKAYVGDGAAKPSPVIVKIRTDKDNTISEVDINGSWYDLSRLFTSYWRKPVNVHEDPKGGEVAFVNSFGDRVSLNYHGYGKASITIRPNGILTHKNFYHYPGTTANR